MAELEPEGAAGTHGTTGDEGKPCRRRDTCRPPATSRLALRTCIPALTGGSPSAPKCQGHPLTYLYIRRILRVGYTPRRCAHKSARESASRLGAGSPC